MKVTDGRGARHPFLRELVAALPHSDGAWTPDPVQLAAFWARVESARRCSFRWTTALC